LRLRYRQRIETSADARFELKLETRPEARVAARFEPSDERIDARSF